jgi:hypothetical protein
MKRSDQEQLLREILEEGEGTDFRAASLARGLDFLRRRQRRVGMARVCAAGVLAGLLVFGLVWHPALRPGATRMAVVTASAPPTETGKVKIITDEELFALFPNRAMALIGPPGQQELIFLDHEDAEGK